MCVRAYVCRGGGILSLFYKQDSKRLRNLPDVVTMVRYRGQFRPRALSASHIICTQHSTHPNTSRNGGLHDSSWGSVAQVGLWQTASHNSLSQLDSGGQDPPASWPAPHRAELAEIVLTVGVLRAPMCPDLPSQGQPLNSPCSLSPLRAGREGTVSEFYFCPSISLIHLAFPTLKGESFILPGAMVAWKARGRLRRKSLEVV